jgi:para-nitrobenzyl esterase
MDKIRIKTMKKYILILNCLLISLSFTGICQLSAPVKVNGGLVQGIVDNGLSIFKGIPFAAPPTGELRWKAPQPPASWEGVKTTTQFAPAPFQGGNPPSGKSEDCLYLNIWSPAKTPQDNLPVLVWIYGGGFSFGSTSEPVYTGENLAKKGVILVSIAYRVGQLGFLAHPELSAENPHHVSGNYGLLDMVAGLQWIQKNIKAFGGNPGKVTIFGESAGGIAVSMLCTSPLAKGLFHGAISQSGGSFGPSRNTTYPGENLKLLPFAEQQGLEYMQKAGATTLADLRKIPADKLPMGFGMPGAWPIIDGYVIPDDQHILYQKGQYNHTPVLIGYNSDEGASFSPPKTPQDYITGVNKRYGKFADELIKAYPVGESNVPKTARDLARDAAFGWHTWSWARLQAQTSKAKVYYYYFDQHPDFPADSPRYGYGSPHGQDVGFVFGHINPSSPDKTATDAAISETIMTYWTNFAKYGDPNGKGVPAWETFTNAKPRVMYFQQKATMGPVPSETALKSLDKYFEWRRTPEGKDWAK